MTNHRLVYVTAASRAQALELGRALVERRLAACINVLEGMTSIYRWEGKIETAAEAVLIAKTSAAKVDDLVAAVRELQDYAVPCALVLPILGGNADYIRWLEESLKG
jgi:periplasmic divalent cation tolerance protein